MYGTILNLLRGFGGKMEYKDIIREIDAIYYNNFNMDSFRCAGRINKKINKIAINQNMKDARKEYNYHAIKNYLEEMVFNKTKKVESAEDLANKILKLALTLGSQDNISIVVIGFNLKNENVNKDI